MRKHPLFLRGASVLLAAMVVGLAVFKWPEIRRSLLDVDGGWAGVGVLIYYLNYLLRALRLRILLPRKLAFWPDGIWIACFHGMTTYLFPMRTGDLSLPMLLKSHCGVDLMAAGRVLVKARLLDVMSLGCFTLFAAVALPAPVSPFFRVVWIGAGTTMVLFPQMVRFLLRFHGWKKIRLLRQLAEVGRVSRFRRAEIGISLGIWLAISGGLYCAARAIHLPIGVGGILFLVTVQLPLQLLPIQGIANAGNHEGGWMAALSLLGIPSDAALRFALTSHTLLLLYVLAISPVLLLFRFFGKNPSGKQAAGSVGDHPEDRRGSHRKPQPAEAENDDR